MGCMLLGATEEAAEQLSRHDFYYAKHAEIFQAGVELLAQREPVDLITLTEHLRKKGLLQDVGGAVYITELADVVPSVANMEFYAKQVKQYSHLRDLLKISMSIQNHCYDTDMPFEEIMSEVEKGLTAISNTTSAIEPENAGIALVRRWEEIEDTMDDPSHGLINTQFPDLDKMLGGIPKGNLVLVGARPSMGKSSFAIQLAWNTGHKHIKTALFSLEMSKDEISDRISGIGLEIDSPSIRRRLVTAQNITDAVNLGNELYNLPFYVDDTSGITTMDLQNACRRLKRKHGLDLVIVDYLGLLADQQKNNQSRNDLVGYITRTLKNMAKELDIVVVALSQLSRLNEHNKDKTPTLSSLRDSGNLEQDANTVLFIHRPDYYDEKDEPGIAHIIVAKQRNGPTGPVRMRFNKKLAKFEAIAKDGWR